MENARQVVKRDTESNWRYDLYLYKDYLKILYDFMLVLNCFFVHTFSTFLINYAQAHINNV